jgi:carbon monoxide dehydrogenase subunit G
MAEESTQSIVIDAEPEAIMAVIADFSSYPQWAGPVKDVEVLDAGSGGRPEEVRFVLDAGVVKDEYVLSYTWMSNGLAVNWHLVRGQMQRSQRGSYVLQPTGSTTRVTYTLAVDLAIPMIGLFKRKAEKVIMDTALKELKRRVES